MSGGGLIFAAILIGWAAFLLPQWLRRDPEVELDLQAGVDLDDIDDGVGEGSDAADLAWVSGSSAGPSSRLRLPRRLHLGRPGRRRPDDRRPAGTRPGGQPPHLSPAAAAARRRRQILAGLLLATVLGAGGAAAGLTPRWALTVPAVLLVGYVALLVAAGRRAARVRATPAVLGGRLQPATGRRAAGPSRRAAVPEQRAASREHGDEQATGPVPTVGAARVAEPDVAVAVAATAASSPAAQPVPGEPAVSGLADSSWAPVSVPLPTYVTAPKARRTIRSIDLGAPGSWTSGRLDPVEAEAYAASFAESRDGEARDAEGGDPAVDDATAPAGDAPARHAVGG